MEFKLENLLLFSLLLFSVQENVFVYMLPSKMGTINTTCFATVQCGPFGFECKNRLCQCDEYYVPSIDTKRCLGGVDQKCLYDEHCINGAYCMNQSICKCKYDNWKVLNNGLVCAGATKHHHIITILCFGILTRFIIHK